MSASALRIEVLGMPIQAAVGLIEVDNSREGILSKQYPRRRQGPQCHDSSPNGSDVCKPGGWREPTLRPLSAAKAYSEARQRERDVILADGTTHADRTPAHWRRVARIVARATGKRVGLDGF